MNKNFLILIIVATVMLAAITQLQAQPAVAKQEEHYSSPMEILLPFGKDNH